MDIITIILFFVYTFGLGFSATYFLKNSNDFFERTIMRIGIGLSVFVVFGVILNLIGLPIDWRIYLVVSLILPAYHIIRTKKLPVPKIRLTKTNIYFAVVLLLFIFTFFMYSKGAFMYEYLEDDDPWHHAQSAKYISVTKTAEEKNNLEYIGYLDPYPPGYSILNGVLHQTSESISWTLKFFNAFIISLSILFFYFFCKKFLKSKEKALIATFILTMIPCYLSHFIWAHALVITLFPVVVYSLEQISEDKRWMYVAMITIGSTFLIQPSQPIKFGIMLGIYALVRLVYERKEALPVIYAGIGGLFVSMLWWYNKFQSFFLTRLDIAESNQKFSGIAGEGSSSIWSTIMKAFPYNSGTATRPYSFSDFFIAEKQNMINNPIGVGIIISILLIAALVFFVLRYRSVIQKKNSFMIIVLLWTIFTFLGINSMTFNLPVGLFAFRFWMLFAIPASILAAIGFSFLMNISNNVGINRMLIVAGLCIGIIFTSGVQKYAVNTAVWPPGATWTSLEEVQGYVWLKENLPPDTKIFAFTRERSDYIIGFDKYMCTWCEEDVTYQKDAINKTAQDLHDWLKRKKYEYVTIGGREAMNYGINKTNDKVNELATSGLFQPVHQTNGVLIFRVV